ncbi:MAG: hypothetical protein IPM82_27315 [Saprospiraceae bacterium]|nr:hypothetical protein [Saprospiraceae bacterium]
MLIFFVATHVGDDGVAVHHRFGLLAIGCFADVALPHFLLRKILVVLDAVVHFVLKGLVKPVHRDVVGLERVGTVGTCGSFLTSFGQAWRFFYESVDIGRANDGVLGSQQECPYEYHGNDSNPNDRKFDIRFHLDMVWILSYWDIGILGY